MTLVFMDFDGTITKKDTFIEFIKYHKPSFVFYSGFLILLPVLIAFKLRLIPNWKAKEYVFSYFFNVLDETMLLKSGNKFAKEVLPKLIRKKAFKEIGLHKKKKSPKI